MFADIEFFIFSVLFRRKSRFNLRGQSFRKNCDSQGKNQMVLIQKLRGNLEDLVRIVFIHGECGNLKGFVDSGKLTRSIKEKKK